MKTVIAIWLAAIVSIIGLAPSPHAQIQGVIFDTHHSGVVLACDSVTCTAAWGLLKLKSTSTKAILLRGNDGVTTDIGFVGNDIDAASAATFCGIHGSPCRFNYYDQIGSQDCTQTSATAMVKYDSTDTLNGHPVGQYAGHFDGYDCIAALGSSVGDGSVVVVANGNPDNSDAVITKYGSTLEEGFNGNRVSFNQTGPTSTAQRISAGGTGQAVTGSVSTNTWYVLEATFNGSLTHYAANGTNVAADNVTSQATVAGTILTIGGINVQGSQPVSTAWNGFIAAEILLSPDNKTNADAIACTLGTYYAISVSGC